jgi:hypothetical protein
VKFGSCGWSVDFQTSQNTSSIIIAIIIDQSTTSPEPLKGKGYQGELCCHNNSVLSRSVVILILDDMTRSNVAPDPLHWWNPRKLILQIILLQLVYSAVATVLITFLVLVMGAPFRLDYLFVPRWYRPDNVFGWSLCFLCILSAAFTYFPTRMLLT